MALTPEEMKQVEAGLNSFIRQPVNAAALTRKLLGELNDMLADYQRNKDQAPKKPQTEKN